ncbi:ATP-binding protein [Mycobacteroides salmoniphilum]|uniref:ATP-binding protein n=1 Tax=Mycobacteroides salmoniphilum TaxID=404941 RepID=UPI003566FAD1
MGILRREFHSAPKRVVGNIRFTNGGVFAEYLAYPTDFFYMSKTDQDGVADEHTFMYRYLPRIASLSGLTAYVDPRDISRSMTVAGLPLDVRRDYLKAGALGVPPLDGVDNAWLNSIRNQWLPHFKRMPLRYRQCWLTLRLDFGRSGDNVLKNVGTKLAGTDLDDPDLIEHYRRIAAEMISTVPALFDPQPAAAEQIWWHWNATNSQGSWRQPIPDVEFDPYAVLDESAFTPAFYDEHAAELFGLDGISEDNPLVRVYRADGDRIADTYQATLPLDDFAAGGLTFPRSALFKLADDLSTDEIVINWIEDMALDPAEKMQGDLRKLNANLKDQFRQRGLASELDSQLPRQVFLTRELAGKVEEGSVERGGYAAIVFSVASKKPEKVAEGVKNLKTELAKAQSGFTQWRGGQKWLAHTFIPGTQAVSDINKLRHRVSSADLGTFVPMVSSQLGDTYGVPLGQDITMPGMPSVVLSDLLGAPTRGKGGIMTLGGDPGRGKSTTAKTLEYSWAEMATRLGIIDPTQVREHERALSTLSKDENGRDRTLVIDVHRSQYSLDSVRMARQNYEILDKLHRQGHTDINEDMLPQPTDHLLGLTGFAAHSPAGRRFQKHVNPKNLWAQGIGDSRGLIEYLRHLPAVEKTSADEELMIELEGLVADDHLKALWDADLTVPNFADYQILIWNVAWLDLPTTEESSTEHLHAEMTPRQRAARALYGLAIDTNMQLFFSRPKEPSVLVVEECYDWINSAAGQKAAYRLMTQGRKVDANGLFIVQNPVKTFNRIGSEFITQRMNFGFKDSGMARDVLEWCGRDLDRHQDLLQQYAKDTSPVVRANRRNKRRAHLHGTVMQGREGEAWLLDELDNFGKVRSFIHPDPIVQATFDTNPMTAMAS